LYKRKKQSCTIYKRRFTIRKYFKNIIKVNRLFYQILTVK